MRADKEKLVSLLINLLGNAVKYTLPGGEVKLSVELQADFVRIHVEDTGVGIPADALTRSSNASIAARIHERLIKLATVWGSSAQPKKSLCCMVAISPSRVKSIKAHGLPYTYRSKLS
jgi:LytS/YehU family sensor histidine kinase